MITPRYEAVGSPESDVSPEQVFAYPDDRIVALRARCAALRDGADPYRERATRDLLDRLDRAGIDVFVVGDRLCWRHDSSCPPVRGSLIAELLAHREDVIAILRGRDPP